MVDKKIKNKKFILGSLISATTLTLMFFGFTSFATNSNNTNPTSVATNSATPYDTSSIVIGDVIPSVNSAKVHYHWTYDASDTGHYHILEYQLKNSEGVAIKPWESVPTPLPNDSAASFEIVGLTGGTTYTVEMRTESQQNVQSKTFTTLSEFSTVSIINVVPSESSAIVTYNWTYDADTPAPTLQYQVLDGNNNPIQSWASVPNPVDNSSSATFSITGLTNSTTYTVQMKTEAGDSSIVSHIFTTSNAPASQITISNVVPSTNDAVVTYNWTYDATATPNPTLEYQVLKTSDSSIVTSWTSVVNPTPNNPNATFTIDKLTGNTQYTVQMRTESGLVVAHNFTTTNQFSIVTITGVSNIGINDVSITYNWIHDQDTTNPTLEYQVLDNNNSPIQNWTTVANATPNNPYATLNITGLIGGTTYTIQMKTEAGDSSIVSQQVTTKSEFSIISISNVTSSINTATITYNWTYDADTPAPTLEYRLKNSNNNSEIISWTAVSNPTPNNPAATFEISNLIGNTTYLLEMRTESGIVITHSFTTLNEFSTITISNVTPSINDAIVTYNWTHDADTKNPSLQYQVLKTSDQSVIHDWAPVPAIPNDPTATFTITGLVGGTGYTVKMKTEAGDSSMKLVDFTTLSEASKITIGLITPSINSAVVTYNWTYDVDTVSSTIDLEYQVLDSTGQVYLSWTDVPNPIANNPTATFTINGLKGLSDYTLQMRTEGNEIVQKTFRTIASAASTVTIVNVATSSNNAIVTYNWSYVVGETFDPSLQYQLVNTNNEVIKSWTNVPNPKPNTSATFEINGLEENTNYIVQMRTESGSVVQQQFTTISSNTNMMIIVVSSTIAGIFVVLAISYFISSGSGIKFN